jgi:hypothetical protein
MMGFRIRGLSAQPFERYFRMPAQELASAGAVLMVADDDRYPCRVGLRHAEVGELVLLLNFEHQSARTPYQSRHAIFVACGSRRTWDARDVVPEVLSTRQLSVRAFDAADMMVNAEVVDGSGAARIFESFLADPGIAYLHVHNAKRGCYAALVTR